MSLQLNAVQLAGHLTRDPEMRYTQTGTAVAEVGIAINRKWKNDAGQTQEEVTFVDVTFWGKNAENIQKYFHKGNPIYIEGRLKLDSWDDKETGNKRYKMKIEGARFQFVESMNSDRTTAPAPQQPQRQSAPPVNPYIQQEDDTDSIPF